MLAKLRPSGIPASVAPILMTAALSNSLSLGRTDAVPQAQLDAILWKSVHGAGSVPPPPGPNAEKGE